MKELKKALILRPVIYVARDAQRAVGPTGLTGYIVITNDSPAARAAQNNNSNITIIKSHSTLDTRELLSHRATRRILKKIANPQIVVFKNTKQIEKTCQENGWILLNPNAELANRVEQKLTQIEWLGPLRKCLPPHRVVKCKNLKWQKEKYIIQFNHAHTGLGTMLIESEKQITELKHKFPNREVRVTKFIYGPVFTNNNIVWGDKILCGNISYQITGLSPFTDRPFATVGNDWNLPHRVLSSKQIKQYKQIATNVGKKLMKDGWRGLFGIDVIMDEKTGKLYLLEINARQPASTTFESQLQKEQGARSKEQVTTFEAHLAALLGLRSTDYGLQKISDGAQVVQRVIGNESRIKNQELWKKRIVKLEQSGFKVIEYNNTKPGEDLIRIQSAHGIMKNPNEFNEIGGKIKNLCNP